MLLLSKEWAKNGTALASQVSQERVLLDPLVVAASLRGSALLGRPHHCSLDFGSPISD